MGALLVGAGLFVGCGAHTPSDANARFAIVQRYEAQLERAIAASERAHEALSREGLDRDRCEALAGERRAARDAAEGVCGQVVRGDADAARRCERARRRADGITQHPLCEAPR